MVSSHLSKGRNERRRDRAVNASLTIGGTRKDQRRRLAPAPLRIIARRGSRSVVVFELADMMLRVELDAELGDKVDLRLEEVDVALLALHKLLDRVRGEVVLDG